MTKRIVAGALWFFAGWYGGALLAEFLGISVFIGPVIGAAAAALVAGDPFRVFWSVRPTAARPDTASSKTA
ncbi:MAG TPA: hypothetical protein VIH00_08970 [Candidatus Limnocylindrales bacterium]